MGLVAPWHVGSSWTKNWTCVPCIGRWILNHCTTREVPPEFFWYEPGSLWNQPLLQGARVPFNEEWSVENTAWPLEFSLLHVSKTKWARSRPPFLTLGLKSSYRKSLCSTDKELPNFFFFFFNLFIYFRLCWVFVSVRGLSLVAASGGHSSSRCAGLSLSRPLLLRSPGSRRASSVVTAHGLSCSAACGIFPDQGSNPCPLHWQADS